MTIPKINLEPDNVYKSKLHRKAMNSYITLMIIATLSIGGYATGQDELTSKKPVIANAQTLTSQSFNNDSQNSDLITQTASIEPLATVEQPSNRSTTTVDRATQLNDWIAKKEPNSPLNNANHDTGKILLEIESETKIKAEFILAKAYQETKLGTQGVCSRNVGSVGETDRDRKIGVFCQDFRSDNQKTNLKLMDHYQTDDYLYKSLREIANTMNNQYLGNSTVLCQLSKGYKGCNDDQIKIMNGKWYASNVHHSEALASLLSDITGQSIDLQFSFKLK